jgi:hypothetical protein
MPLARALPINLDYSVTYQPGLFHAAGQQLANADPAGG